MNNDQAVFFDRIYPQISKRLQNLEDANNTTRWRFGELMNQIKIMEFTIDQYKKKIQKIEQALIIRGLDSILKGIHDD